MTINKEKWQELAEKYDTKAKWADAILLLNLEDHEDLISALIELDPQDILEKSKGTEIYTNFGSSLTSAPVAEVQSINVTPIRDAVQENLKVLDKIIEESRAQQQALEDQLNADNAGIKESLEFISSKLDEAEKGHTFSVFGTTPEDFYNKVNRARRDLGRDYRPR